MDLTTKISKHERAALAKLTPDSDVQISHMMTKHNVPHGTATRMVICKYLTLLANKTELRDLELHARGEQAGELWT